MFVEDLEEFENVEVYADTYGNPIYVEKLRDDPAPPGCPASLVEYNVIFIGKDGNWVVVTNTAAVDGSWDPREPDVAYHFRIFYRATSEEIMELRDYDFEGFPADVVFNETNGNPLRKINDLYPHLGLYD